MTSSNKLEKLLEDTYDSLYHDYKEGFFPDMVITECFKGQQVYDELYQWSSNEHESAMFTVGYIKGVQDCIALVGI